MVHRPYRPHRVPSIRAVGPGDDSPGRNPGQGGTLGTPGTRPIPARPHNHPINDRGGIVHHPGFRPDHPAPGVSPRSSTPRGFALGNPGFRPGLSSGGPTGRAGGTSTRHNHQQPNNSTTQHASRHPYTPYQTTEHVAVRWSCCMRTNTPISSYGYQPHGLGGSAHVA